MVSGVPSNSLLASRPRSVRLGTVGFSGSGEVVGSVLGSGEVVGSVEGSGVSTVTVT